MGCESGESFLIMARTNLSVANRSLTQETLRWLARKGVQRVQCVVGQFLVLLDAGPCELCCAKGPYVLRTPAARSELLSVALKAGQLKARVQCPRVFAFFVALLQRLVEAARLGGKSSAGSCPCILDAVHIVGNEAPGTTKNQVCRQLAKSLCKISSQLLCFARRNLQETCQQGDFQKRNCCRPFGMLLCRPCCSWCPSKTEHQQRQPSSQRCSPLSASRGAREP